MHFLFNLLRIKGLYTFRTLLAHLQEAHHKREDWNGTGISDTSSTPIVLQPTNITRTKYTKRCLCWVFWGWASNARNMYRPLILNKLNKKCIALVSLHWYTTSMMHGQQNLNQQLYYLYKHFILRNNHKIFLVVKHETSIPSSQISLFILIRAT
jgi:hypothetical protein